MINNSRLPWSSLLEPCTEGLRDGLKGVRVLWPVADGDVVGGLVSGEFSTHQLVHLEKVESGLGTNGNT